MMAAANELQERKRHNLSWLLFALTAVFWVMNRYRGGNTAMAGYVFSSVIAFPGLFLLLGREAREQADQRDKLIASGVGMILLGYAQKVLLFWVETVLGRAPAFHPFSTSGAPWFFLVGGVYLLLAGVVRERKWMKRWLLPLTVAAGMCFGLLKHFGDDLCVARTVTYLPFFVAGLRLDMEHLERWSKPLRVRLLSLAALGGAAGFCLLRRSKWAVLRGLIDGNKAYGSIDGISDASLGPVWRLGYYLAAAVLVFALFCLVPAWKVRLLSDQGRRWKSGYFWFSVTVLLMTLPMEGKRSLASVALTGALLLAGLLIAPSKWMNRLPDAILNGPERLRRERPEEQAPANALHRGSFYQRHRWGIQTAALFTGCFLVVAVAYVYPFFSTGKSLIWNTDGMGQQYPAMFYFKRYVLTIFTGFLETGRLTFPQWDFTLGFGMSPLDALRREPFMLLSLLGNEQTMEAIADLTVLLRLYVCGLVFLWFCATLGRRERVPAVTGAIAYIASGFAIFTSVRQPYFITIFMTYEVLMLIGAERYLQKRKYGVFVLSVFLQLLSGYYSAYVNGLILALYLLIRLGFLYGKDLRRFATELLKLIGFYSWGACMAMFAVLPSVWNFFNSSRSGGDRSLELFYTKSYYLDMLQGLNLEFGGVGYWTHISMAAIVWLACVLLFLRRRKQLAPLKVGLVTGAVLISCPVFGVIANGFDYVSNRWCYSIALLTSLILVEMLPELVALSRRDKGILLGVTLFYSAAVVANENRIVGRVEAFGLITLCMTALVVLFQDQVIRSKRLRTGILSGITVLTVMLHLAASYLPELGGYADSFAPTGTPYSKLSNIVGDALPLIEGDDSFYRIGQFDPPSNQGGGLGYYGTNAYYSIIPIDTSRFFMDVCLSRQGQSFTIDGLNDRAALNALLSVKYYVTKSGGGAPYGFTEAAAGEDGGVQIYENRNALPLAYTYTSYYPQVEYDKLSPLERQQILLEHVVWDGSSDFLERGTPSFREERISCTVTKAENVTLDEEKKRLNAQKNGTIEFSFEGQPDCETYLVIDGLRYAESNAKTCDVTCRFSGGKDTTVIRGVEQSYYFEREASIFHLGYSEDAKNSCTLSFSGAFNGAYDDLYVVCIPVTEMDEKVDALREVVLEDAVETGDHIQGTIDLEEHRMLVFSVPYAAGWTAKVNGVAQPVERVNGMFCGLYLAPGSYEIELRYVQPGHTAGSVISATAFAALIPVAAVSALRRRKDRRQRS